MLYTLALLAAILCLPSCSEEEEVIGGPLPLSIQIFIQDAKGQDLLNETNEGALWKSDWKIDIDGVETPLSSKDRPTQLGFEKPADSTPGIFRARYSALTITKNRELSLSNGAKMTISVSGIT